MLKDDLVKAFLATHAFQWDPDKGFTLASGIVSPFYVDCRTLMAHPSARELVAQLAFETLKGLSFDCVGGMEIGAIPLSTAISDYAYRTARKEWRTFVVRKQPKDHGLGKLVEGIVQPGDRALIVDDVLTSGGSVLKSIKAAREAGMEVSHALVIVDRQEQEGRARVSANAVTLLNLLTIEDLHKQRKT